MSDICNCVICKLQREVPNDMSQARIDWLRAKILEVRILQAAGETKYNKDKIEWYLAGCIDALGEYETRL